MSRNTHSGKRRPGRRGERRGPAEAVSRAVRLHRTGHLGDAEKLYRAILASVPDHPDVLHFLGVLCYQTGDSAEAESLIRKALEIQPGYVDAHNNLGNIFMESDRLDEAATAYCEALRLDPDHADAHNNLGTVLRAEGRLEGALGEYRRAVSLAPEHADAHHNLGTALWLQGKGDEAASSYCRSLELRPYNPEVYMALSQIFYRSGRRSEGRAVFEKWLDGDPDSAIAQHMVAACGGNGVPERASDAYVRETFDRFAASFDRSLKNLRYRAPDLIRSMVAGSVGKPDGRLRVLDAGCGTGLCGPLLRPYCNRLVGVDLSEKMLDRARRTGSYDELVVAELTAFLRHSETPYDLIVSADTLVYFGKLDDVFRGAASSLTPGGRLVFTVELLDQETGTGFELEPHGRYCHDEGYVRTALARGGLTTRSIVQESLRLEGDEPVPGLVVLAERPGPT